MLDSTCAGTTSLATALSHFHCQQRVKAHLKTLYPIHPCDGYAECRIAVYISFCCLHRSRCVLTVVYDQEILIDLPSQGGPQHMHSPFACLCLLCFTAHQLASYLVCSALFNQLGLPWLARLDQEFWIFSLLRISCFCEKISFARAELARSQLESVEQAKLHCQAFTKH